MRFGPVQKDYFLALDGAYSIVTEREVYDSQITLTGEEVDVVAGYFGPSGIHQGNVRSNPKAALKLFSLFNGAEKSFDVALNLVYCKDDKSELRLYLRKDQFKPEPGEIWFIYVSNDKRLCLGSMDEEKWRSLGREDFDDEKYIADIYDEPKPIQYVNVAPGKALKRDPSLAIVRFKATGHKCEADPSHNLFTSRLTGMPFLEAHHLFPIKYQSSFKSSLDILENIIALCPFCHRLIHHATVGETRPLIEKLFDTRPKLESSLQVNKRMLFRFYNCEKITE